MGIENKREDDLDKMEKQKQQEKTKNALDGFWEDKELSKKLLEDPKWWENAVSAIKWDIEEKTKNINDPKTKELVNDKMKSLDKYSKIGKLNEAQAKELSDIYKEISSLEWTEAKEWAQGWEDAKKSIDAKNQDYAQKLTDAVEKLDKLMKSHHEEAQAKVKADLQKAQEARNNPPEDLPNLDTLPTASKEVSEKA